MSVVEMAERLNAAHEARIHQEKSEVKAAVRMFLDDHPEVEAMEVKTYTPSFNDGDPCEFTITEPRVLLKGTLAPQRSGDEDPEDDEVDYDEDDENYFDEHGVDSYGVDDKNHPTLAADLKALGEIFELMEEAFEVLFGNGSRITFGRDCEARVVEYDCGY